MPNTPSTEEVSIATWQALKEDRDQWKHRAEAAEALSTRWAGRTKLAQEQVRRLVEQLQSISEDADTTQVDIKRLLRELNLGG